MKYIINKLRQSNLTFLFLNIYIVIMIFLPKTYSNIFGLPIRLILTFLFIGVAIYEIKKKKIELNNRSNKFLYIIFILFLLSTIPSIFVSKTVITSLYTIVKFFSSFILFILLYKIKFTKEEYVILLKNLIISSFIICIVGIIQYVFGLDLMVKNSGIDYYPGAKGRLATTFFNTIYYGIFINLVFAIVFYLLNNTKKIKTVIFLIVLCGLLYLNLIFTFTRSAIIIFFAIFLMLIVLLNKKIFNLKTLIVVITILTISFYVPGAQPLIKKTGEDTYAMVSKFTNLLNFLPSINSNSSDKDTDDSKEEEYLDYDSDSDYIDYSLQHRESFARIAKQIANDNLYTGVGFGAYIEYMESEDFSLKYPEYVLPKTHPHSSLILIFAETGIFGMLFLIISLISIALMSFVLIIRNFKKNKLIYQISSVAFAISAGFLVVNFMSENAIYDTQISYLFMSVYGLLLSFCYVQEEEKKVLFISSTGGHLNELLQLSPLFEKYDSYLITEKTKSTNSLKHKYKKVNYLVYGTKDHRFIYIFKFIWNCLKSVWFYLRIGPNVIVTTGTHTAVPICYIGKLFGCKIIFIETFANSETKTLSGKLVYPIANTFIVQWENMLKLYPKAIYGGWIY